MSGGARSGKSTFADRYAKQSGRRVVYVATARVLDEEMKARVQTHRASRPSVWLTVEEPYNLEKALWRYGRQPDKLVLVDCLTMWLANILLQKVGFQGEQLMADTTLASAVAADIIVRAKNAAVLAAKVAAEVVLVTNEVGWGPVPDNPLARLYRDLASLANQAFAAQATEFYLLVAGLPLQLK